MYICVCKAVTDRQIKQAIDNGACTRRQLQQCTGAGGVCGKCTHHLRQMLDENRQSHLIIQAA
jgi:bacterioferritin-associated ferredoxin